MKKKSAPKKKRTIFRILWSSTNASGRGRWELTEQDVMSWRTDKVLILHSTTKWKLTQEARARAKAVQPSQLVIHGKNGRIQTEHTYGNDPRRSVG